MATEPPAHPAAEANLNLRLSEDDIEETLYLARTQELAELQLHVSKVAAHYSVSALQILDAGRDEESGNGAAHYAAANGFVDILTYILHLSGSPSVSGGEGGTAGSGSEPSREAIALLKRPNKAGNTPLHYAALNGHTEVVKLLVEMITDEAEREDFVGLKNAAGKDAVYEAEMADKNEVIAVLLGAAGVGTDSAEAADGDADIAVANDVGASDRSRDPDEAMPDAEVADAAVGPNRAGEAGASSLNLNGY